MEQTGKQPDPNKIPLEFEDLTYDGQLAYNIYSKLGNRVESNIGFVGKDYSNLPILIEIYNIIDKEYLLDLLLLIEIFYINENSKQIEKIMNKNKPKTP